MKLDPREPEREAMGARVTRNLGRLTTLALAAGTAILLLAVVLGRA